MGRLPRDLEGRIAKAVSEAKSLGDSASWAIQGVLGTNIHVTAKGYLDTAKLKNPALYANIYAEVSLDLEQAQDPDVIGVTYGTAGSTRLDVMELVSAEMGCVYDYKTGLAGLTTARVLKIVAA